MAEIERVSLGPWPKGLVNAIAPEMVGVDALTKAVNVDIDRAGAIHVVAGWASIDGDMAHSLFSHNGVDYAVIDGTLGVVLPQGFQPIANVAGRLAWSVLLGEPVFTDGNVIRIVRGASLVPLHADIRADEDELMLAQLPAGSCIAYWQGRLLVARGTTLFVSEPLRYGVYDQLRGTFRFEQQIQWLAALQGGVYIGLRGSVHFLQGANPLEWERKDVSGLSSAGVVVSTKNIPVAQEFNECVVWHDECGFVIGLPTGQTIRPQADRLKDLHVSPGTMAVEGDRLTVVFE